MVIDKNTIRLNNIAFSNYCYWADVNPHWTRKQYTQHTEKSWFGILGVQFVGAFLIGVNPNAKV